MKKLLLLAALLFLAYLAFGTGFGEYLKPQFYQQLYQEHPTLTLGAYFIAYVLMAVLSIPAAALMTLLSGVVFGFWVGLVLISFASSIGATFSFLIAQ